MVIDVKPNLIGNTTPAQQRLHVSMPNTWEEVRDIIRPNNLWIFRMLARLEPSKSSLKGAEARTPTNKHHARLLMCVVNQPLNCRHNASQQAVQEKLIFARIYINWPDLGWFLDVNLLRSGPLPSLPFGHFNELFV